MLSHVLLTLILAAPPQAQVQAFSGENASGKLIAISPEVVTLETANGPLELRVENLLSVSLPSQSVANTDPAEVVTVDGSVLPAKDFTVVKGKVKLVAGAGAEVSLATSDIARVRFQPLNEELEQQWNQLLQLKPATDLLVIRKDNALDYLEGIVGDIEERINFESDGETIRAKREKVFGIIYFQKAGRKLQPTICQMTETGGAQLRVAKFTFADGQVKLTTSAGIEIARPLTSIARFDFSQGKVQYLSDLKPISSKGTAIFADDKVYAQPLLVPIRLDRSLDGGALALDERTFAKGIAVRSENLLVYRLSREFRRFQTVVGIDNSVGNHGHVELIIRGDDKVLFKGEISGNDKPRGKSLDLDISGCDRLEIQILKGRDLFIADHVDFCDARIIK